MLSLVVHIILSIVVGVAVALLSLLLAAVFSQLSLNALAGFFVGVAVVAGILSAIWYGFRGPRAIR